MISTPRVLTSIATALATAAALTATASGADADRLVLLDGAAIKGDVVAIEPGGLVRFNRRAQMVELAGLRRIEPRGVEVHERTTDAELLLLGGGRIPAEEVTFDGTLFRVTWAFGKVDVPAELVEAIRLGAAPGEEAAPRSFTEAVAERGIRRDRLFVVTGETVQAVKGALQAIGDTDIRFLWQGEARSVKRDKVVGLVLAGTAARHDHVGECFVHMTDGSRLWGEVQGMARGRLTLNLAEDRPLDLPWDQVALVEVRSDRMVFLSDLDPIDVQQEAIVTYPGPWRRDLNVVGETLTLADRTYEKGLGVHSACELTYDVGGRFDLFAATIGIDAGAGGLGDCVFRVLADGRQLYEKRVRGTDHPRAIRVPIQGAEHLTLLVDWGQDLDVGDRADWCDARVLKQPDEE